jgi:predicted DNA-binding protein YlxM (UPF0122 family)
MESKDKTLTDKQIKFIDLYFKDYTIQNICKKLDISRQTYYNYLKDDSVKEKIQEIRAEILKTTTNLLQNNLKVCSNELIKIIKNKETAPQIKINAINSVFNNYNKLAEIVDITERLNNIEQILSNQEQSKNQDN